MAEPYCKDHDANTARQIHSADSDGVIAEIIAFYRALGIVPRVSVGALSGG